MKLRTAFLCLVALTACKRTDPLKSAEDAAKARDMPLLPVTKGDVWTYDVRLEIPAEATGPGSKAVDTHHPRTRTYIGKVVPAKDAEEVDCFEITVPNSPVEREYVEIRDDAILMRGSLLLTSENARPMLLAKPVPFVIAGIKPGTALPEGRSPGGESTRNLQVVAREDVGTKAGDFPSVRLLMSGMEGLLELRRTIWFAPGVGIVREEKTRYRKGKLIYRETH